MQNLNERIYDRISIKRYAINLFLNNSANQNEVLMESIFLLIRGDNWVMFKNSQLANFSNIMDIVL